MTSGASRAAWPAAAAPPRLLPALARIPRDPAARDHRWPERWPLRTHLELAALDTAPGSARAHVRAVLHEWRADGDATETAALIVTELLTNAVESTWEHHRQDPVHLWLLGDGDSVLFLVWDATTRPPVLAVPAPGDERGRGLTLVNDLCGQWGHYHPAEPPFGKVVWALMHAEPRSGICPALGSRSAAPPTAAARSAPSTGGQSPAASSSGSTPTRTQTGGMPWPISSSLARSSAATSW